MWYDFCFGLSIQTFYTVGRLITDNAFMIAKKTGNEYICEKQNTEPLVVEVYPAATACPTL